VLAPFALVCVCCCGALGLGIPALLEGLGKASRDAPTTNL
jgi:hypothetical protein